MSHKYVFQMEHKIKKDLFMANETNKEKHLSVRVTNGTHSDLTIYAKAHNMTITKAVEELLQEGLKAKNEPVATKVDIERLVAETKRIQEQQDKLHEQQKRFEEQQETAKLALVQAIQNQPIEIQKFEPPKRSFFDRFRKEKKTD